MFYEKSAMKVCWLALAAGIVLALGAAPWASAQADPKPIKLSLKSAPAVKRGEKFQAVLTAQIADGWHLYSMQPIANGPMATRIEVPGGQAFEAAGNILASDPLVAFDPNFEMNVEYYETEAKFRIPLKPASRTSAGRHPLTIDVVFQTCNDHICLPPTKTSVNASILVSAASTKSAPKSAGP